MSVFSGLNFLSSILSEEQDDNVNRLHYLLCSSLLAVYTTLFVHALAIYDTDALHRIMSHPLSVNIWPLLFGGTIHGQSESSTGAVRVSSSGSAKERFLPPTVSMVNYFMAQVRSNVDNVIKRVSGAVIILRL